MLSKLANLVLSNIKPQQEDKMIILDTNIALASKQQKNRTIEEHETFNDEHEQIGIIIRRAFNFLVAASLFFTIAISGAPDIQLLKHGAVVTLPIINYDVEFFVFLIIGPIIIMGTLIYLYIFIEYQRRYASEHSSTVPRLI